MEISANIGDHEEREETESAKPDSEQQLQSAVRDARGGQKLGAVGGSFGLRLGPPRHRREALPHPRRKGGGMKVQILDRWTSACLWEGEADDLRAGVVAAVKGRADLSRANLSRADLSGADLGGADLSRADLGDANLSDANLSDANLSGANLRRAKADVWEILMHAIPEVPAL